VSISALASTSSQVDEPSILQTSDVPILVRMSTLAYSPHPNLNLRILRVRRNFLYAASAATASELRMMNRLSKSIYPTDVGLWQIPATHDMREFWTERGSEPCQNKKSEYPKSRLEDGNRQLRYFPSSLFSYVQKPTQTKFDRPWLCYSESANKIFCFHCTLFASDVSDNLFCCGGFNDWKNVHRAVTVHEKSADNLESLEKYVALQTERARIDESLLKQCNACIGDLC